MVPNDPSLTNSVVFTITTGTPPRSTDTLRTKLRGSSKMDNCKNMCVWGIGLYQKREDDKVKEAKVSSPEPFSKEGAKHASGSKAEINDPPRKEVIRMIVGGPVGGDSHHARKSQIRETYDILEGGTGHRSDGRHPRYPIWKRGTIWAENLPQWRSYHHSLTCQQRSRSYLHRFRNLRDILSGEAYNQMQLGDIPLEKLNTSLYGFVGKVVHLRVMISLPLTLGTEPTRKTCMLKFLVVDVSSAYNVILGRPTLNVFQAVISTYHMKIKFPTPGGIKEVQGEPLQSHKCYIEALTRRIAALSRFISKAVEKNLPLFKVLRKAKNFGWVTSCQQAFEELKNYLARLPLLVKPTQGDTLYNYLFATSKTVSFVLVREDEGKQMPIYCFSKVLNGAEGRYTLIEKMVLALMLGKVGRGIKRVRYFVFSRTTIKAQALANFVSEMAGISWEDTSKNVKWLLHVDGSFTIQGSNAGVVITSPQGEDLEFTVKFDFKASNNGAEYEALVIGLKIAHEVGTGTL
ncbi:hypothetical protein Sango_1725700 [Sesamum angolense]|uniref:Reverse transcriptase/retrotransposon-derived protein RNase H-like domain-containing protein n=1 Tax=Sesamum angolense TaxID=2727404 RepID=A0AAE1WM33_9LAMI|nr:hypothetical protein Sango_1725700 [Sesamum angolense]